MRDKLENRILEFFDLNPDEELTTDDAQVKYDINLNQCRMVMQSMAERGLVHREHRRIDGRWRFIYSAARVHA